MKYTYIVVQVPADTDYDKQAEHLQNVGALVEDGFVAGQDKQARFETIDSDLYIPEVMQVIKEAEPK